MAISGSSSSSGTENHGEGTTELGETITDEKVGGSESDCAQPVGQNEMAESDAESTPLKETATSEKASRKSSSAERTNCILENQKPILFALG